VFPTQHIPTVTFTLIRTTFATEDHYRRGAGPRTVDHALTMAPPNAISREQAYLAAIASQPKDAAPERLYEVSPSSYLLCNSLTDAQKLEILGKGAYGAVYRGRHIQTGHIVALKIINLDTEDDDVGDIQKEISLLQQLMMGVSGGAQGVQSLNVIKYYGSLMDGPKVWIIMECAEGGSIRTLVSPVPPEDGPVADDSRGRSRSRSLIYA